MPRMRSCSCRRRMVGASSAGRTRARQVSTLLAAPVWRPAGCGWFVRAIRSVPTNRRMAVSGDWLTQKPSAWRRPSTSAWPSRAGTQLSHLQPPSRTSRSARLRAALRPPRCRLPGLRRTSAPRPSAVVPLRKVRRFTCSLAARTSGTSRISFISCIDRSRAIWTSSPRWWMFSSRTRGPRPAS